MYKNNVRGILLLDKPSGISSNNILQKIKNIFKANKVGYAGTLDPLATGILPICFGVATKFSDYLISSPKLYSVTAKFGQITDTYDSTGKILEERNVNFKFLDLFNALNKLTGSINQVVPRYSAVKFKGSPLYKYSRKNIYVPKITKNIQIYQLNCLMYNKLFIKLRVLCSKGTYIRSLIHDLGQLLKCGAHVINLRRLQVSSYKISQTITYDQLYHLSCLYSHYACYNLIYKFLLPIENIFFNLPEVVFSNYNSFLQQRFLLKLSNLHTQNIRITISNNLQIFILGKLNHEGKLISYKLLNFINNSFV